MALPPSNESAILGTQARPSLKTQINATFAELLARKSEDTGEPRYIQFVQNLLQEAETNPSSPSGRMVGELLLKGDVLAQLDEIANREKRENIDFLAFRLFKMGHAIQQEIMLSNARVKYLMAGRRAGKTEVLKFLIAKTMMVIDGARVLYIAKTKGTAVEQIYNETRDMMVRLFGVKVKTSNLIDGLLSLENESSFKIIGNTTTEDREKLRGYKWDLAIIDEAQSQAALPYLINDILEPALIDRSGTLVISGTGPRVRGTYWEMLWTGNAKASKWNWNLTDNPFIPDHATVLEQIKESKGLTDSSPLFLREYLGRIAYDDDALVYRLTDANYYTEADVAAWMRSQPPSDIEFTAGLDYGFTDADGFAIVMSSKSKPERWLVHEYKARRTGLSEVVSAIKAGIELVGRKYLAGAKPSLYVYADQGGGGAKMSYELATQYGLPVLDAYKHNKDLAIEQLQEEVRRGMFKVPKDGIFAEEAIRTVFARNDRDELTRETDDDTYHPDLIDAVLYAMRPIWLFNNNQQT